MFMSVVARDPGTETFPELAGSRIVVTGLTRELGVDLARAFAERHGRLIVQSAEQSPEIVEIAAMLAERAPEFQLFDTAFDGNSAPTRFIQTASTSLGGVDTMINLVTLSPEDLADRATLEEIEDLVVAKLSAMRELTEVAANRMALTWSNGMILNIVACPAPCDAREALLCGIVRTALAAMTVDLARRWSTEEIRINAIGPKTTVESGATVTSEADLAALALYLASRKGRQLTGQVFDAEGVSRRHC